MVAAWTRQRSKDDVMAALTARTCRALPCGPPATVDRPTTLLGQDTDRVLSELLGLTPDELAALHAAGVIEPVKS